MAMTASHLSHCLFIRSQKLMATLKVFELRLHLLNFSLPGLFLYFVLWIQMVPRLHGAKSKTFFVSSAALLFC